jgi:tryptophan 2,3-dioxygenase
VSETIPSRAGDRTYGEILRLDQLLTMQERLGDVHDGIFFTTIHQIYELWFRVMLHELEAARDAIFCGDLEFAIYCLTRVKAVERVMVAQVETLETLHPGRFLQIREQLEGTSGFQSAQFREIEFLSGLKDPGYLQVADLTPVERARLERRLAEPTLWDAFLNALERHDGQGLVELIRTPGGSPLRALAEALLDHDEGLSLWRLRHIYMVERMIGKKTGTGGSSGVAYLESTLHRRFYPALWELRSQL